MQQEDLNHLVFTDTSIQLPGIFTEHRLIQALNSEEIYKLVETLQQNVSRLETEKLDWVENHNYALEMEVYKHTAELRKQLETEKLCNRIAQMMISVKELQPILNAIVHEVHKFLLCDRVFIYCFNPDSTDIILAKSGTEQQISFLNQVIDNTDFSIISEKFDTHTQLQVIPDIYQGDLTDGYIQFLEQLQIRATILVPILKQGKIWGLLSVSDKEHPRNWQEFEVNLLEKISTQIAIAIQQVDTHKQLQLEITKRQQTEMALQACEKRYTTLAEIAPVGILRINTEGQCIYVNKHWCQMTGIGCEQAMGRGWITALHPEDREKIQQEFCVAAPVNQPFALEYRLQKPDNSITWVLSQVAPEQQEDKQISSYVSTIIDITEIKQTQADLETLTDSRTAILGEEFFPALLSYIATVLNIRYILLTKQKGVHCETTVFSADGKIQPNFSGCGQDMPCELTKKSGSYCCPSQLQENFPHQIFQEMTIESYLGVTIKSKTGEVLGCLCLLHDQPLLDSRRTMAILKVFAARIGVELERQQAMTGLEQLNQELEIRVEESTAELRASQERWELALRGSNDGIWDWNLRTNQFFYSSRWKQIRGLSKNDIGPTIQEWSNLIHIDDYEWVMAAITDHLAGKTPFFQAEYRVKCKDGSYMWVLDRGQALWDDKGNVLRVVGSETDITDRREAEKKLKHHLTVIEAAVDGIAILENNTFTYLNKAHLQLFGYENADELLNQSWQVLYSQEEISRFQTEVFPVLMEDSQWRGEAIATRKDGSHFYEGLSLTLTEGGTLICVCRDISNIKQAEQELKNINEQLTLTNAELQRATRLKDEFLANMSHELRTPLNAILGLSEGLEDGIFGKINHRQQKAIATIEESGRHLLELINDILDLSKIESGKLQLQLTSVPIKHLVDSCLLFVRQQAIKKNICLTVSIPDHLGEICVDELRIRQVLINLLNNAIKFTPEGGSVRLETNLEKSYLVIAVIDTGIGIAPDDINKLFQPFVQVDSKLSRQYGGTGLGLALVRRLVELHNGAVAVTSEVGKGSCFTVKLPYYHYSALDVSPCDILPQLTISSEYHQVLSEKLQPTPTIPLILMVEDNEANIDTVSNYLESRGYRLLIAKTAQEAIKLAKAHIPDLILMDMQMSEIDSLETTSLIRTHQNLAHIPIIALTDSSMLDNPDKCLQLGVNEYVSKPVKLSKLTEIIQNLLKY